MFFSGGFKLANLQNDLGLESVSWPWGSKPELLHNITFSTSSTQTSINNPKILQPCCSIITKQTSNAASIETTEKFQGDINY